MQFKLKDSDKTYSFLEAIQHTHESNFGYKETKDNIEFFIGIFSIPRENRLEFLRVFDENWQELDYY